MVSSADPRCALLFSIRDISMDIAESRRPSGERAMQVEQCSCPAGYTGLSCEVRSVPCKLYTVCPVCPVNCIRQLSLVHQQVIGLAGCVFLNFNFLKCISLPYLAFGAERYYQPSGIVYVCRQGVWNSFLNWWIWWCVCVCCRNVTLVTGGLAAASI